mgnify:CR=1 FL=1
MLAKNYKTKTHSMTSNTQQVTDVKELKRLKLETIRDFHQDLIDDLEIPCTDFNMKMPFYDKHGRMVVGIFSSEFRKEKGFFFELITRDLTPADADRKVYRVPVSSSYEEEYELNEKGSYLVPLEELRVVNPTSVAIKKTANFGPNQEQALPSSLPKAPMQAYKAPATMEDAPYSEMTIRDYYAIQTGKPVSSKMWLNELIKSTK